MLKKILLPLLLLATLLSATAPTQESVTKLYVATFDRAPDAKGLAYWLNDSALSLEQIAMSFFDQKETREKYPLGTTAHAFVKAVYANLFNREPDDKGWAYWAKELDSGKISRPVFILAVVNGALGDDAIILNHKMEVGRYFAEKGLDDTNLAKRVMAIVTADPQSVVDAKKMIDGEKPNPTPPSPTPPKPSPIPPNPDNNDIDKVHQKSFSYDSANRVVKEDLNNGNYIEYTYDNSGNLVKQSVVK